MSVLSFALLLVFSVALPLNDQSQQGALSHSRASSATDSAAIRADVRRWREAHESEILAELAALLAIPNLASDSVDIRRNAAALVTMLQRRGISARLLESPAGGPPSVFGELQSPGASRTLVMYAHYDGQPVLPPEWATPPWTPTLRSGPLDQDGQVIPFPAPGERVSGEARLYARSASDDKSPIVAMLAALDALRASGHAPSVNLKFFFEGEEEAGSQRLRPLLEEHASLLQADVWIFADGPRHQSGAMQIVYGVRGSMGAQLTVYGPARALHSGHYGNWAPNPAARLVSLISSLRDDDGRITIPGFHDDVRPLSDAERGAVEALPNTDRDIAASLAIARPEGEGERLIERIMQPAINVTGMRVGGVGSQASNTINTSAHAALDFRLVPNQTPARVRELVESHLRARGWHVVHAEPDMPTRAAHDRVVRISWSAGYAGVRTDLASPAARAVGRAVAEAVDGEVLHVPSLGGSLPLAHFEEVLGASIITVPIVNADNNQHAANENVRIQNLWDGIEIFAQLMARLDAVWP